jgi:transcriptional regulator of arginine metabolism
MSSKQQRQQMIMKIIASHNVSSQPELQKLLARNKVDATQATISRDLEELGAVKVRVAGGEPKYAIPEFEPQRVAPSDQLRRVVGEWVAEVTHSGNLVVVRTPPGCAHVVASALDRGGMKGLIGTVAGDDTVLCVASEQVGGRRLAAQLGQLAGIAKKDDSSGTKSDTKSDMKSGTKPGTKPGAQTAKKKVSSRG